MTDQPSTFAEAAISLMARYHARGGTLPPVLVAAVKNSLRYSLNIADREVLVFYDRLERNPELIPYFAYVRDQDESPAPSPREHEAGTPPKAKAETETLDQMTGRGYA